MTELNIVFSERAKNRLLDIFDYIHQQTLSKEFAFNYINKFESFLKQVLIQFPEAGTPMPQYGKGIRRIVYQRYSFLYQVKSNRIEILSVYRENNP